MTGNRFVRFGQPQHNDPRFARLLAISLAFHVVIALVFMLGLGSRFAAPAKTVYYVDLTQLPVKDPRAGRPTPPAPKAKTPPPETRKPEPAKAVPKPTPKPASKPPAVSKPKTDTTSAAIAKLREEQQRSNQEKVLKEKLAALAAEDTRDTTPAAASDAPLGSETGRGQEIGPDQQVWLRAMIKEQWNLSRYQLEDLNLEARLEMVYGADGHLLSYSFVSRSKDRRFDDSIIRTMLKMKEIVLPVPPERRTTIQVRFNLKELMSK